MLAVVILALIGVSAWLCYIVVQQKNEIAVQKSQLKYLSDKLFAESYAAKTNQNMQSNPAGQTPQTTAPPVNPANPYRTGYNNPPPYPQYPQGYNNPPPYRPSYNVPPPQYIPPTPAYGTNVNTAYQTGAPAKRSSEMESWLGRNVIGIVASILIFIGLVYLGVLAYEYITETGKIIAMFAISTVILGLGIGLTCKFRNNFTLILTGCGCGSFFISILLTHIYFNKINDIAAFSLLLVWMTATLVLSKIITSTQISIVAHIGMAISICFAFAQGLSDEKLAVLLIYQGAATIIILLGNIFCCRKTYRLGIFVSLALTIAAGMFMWSRFSVSSSDFLENPFTTALPTAYVATAFFAQFICGSFLSYLLSVSASRSENEGTQIAIHLANKALWITSLFMNVYFVVYRIAGGAQYISPQQQLSAALPAVLITLGVILIHAVITIILSLKLNFSGKLETVSILVLSGVAAILLLVLWSMEQVPEVFVPVPAIPWLFAVSLFLMLAKQITKNKAYLLGAGIILTADVAFMFASGYKELNNFGTVFLSMGYLILVNILIWVQWFMLAPEERSTHSITVRLLSYFITELSVAAIIITSSLEYKAAFLLLILTAINIVLSIFRFDRDTEQPYVMEWIFGLNEFALISLSSLFIAFVHKDPTSSVLYLLLAVLAFGLAFTKINKVLDGSNNSILGIWTGFKLTILTIALIYGNSQWFEQTYIFSVACMLVALLCIILGFIGRLKSLRLYGLSLILLCVLKLVLFDMTNLNTMLRVVAYIGGGIICFAISAIYNYTSKRISND